MSSDNSALMKNVARHEYLLDVSLASIGRSLLHMSRSFGDRPPDEGEITCLFDGRIVTDAVAEKEQDEREVGVTMAPFEYRMKWYGEDGMTARGNAEGFQVSQDVQNER